METLAKRVWWNWGIAFNKTRGSLLYTLRTIEDGEHEVEHILDDSKISIVQAYFTIELFGELFISRCSICESIAFLKENNISIPQMFTPYIE